MRDTVIYNPTRKESRIEDWFPGQYKQVDSMLIEKSDSWLAGDKTTYYLNTGEVWPVQSDNTILLTGGGLILIWLAVIFMIVKTFLYLRSIKKGLIAIRKYFGLTGY